MASKDDDYSDLVQMASSSRRVQDLIKKLPEYFDIESVAEDGYTYIPCADEGMKLLDNVRDEFKKDVQRSKTIPDVVKAMIPRPGTNYFLSSVRLLGFRGGPAELEDIGGQDVCIVLIPAMIEGSGKAALEDPETERRKDITIKAQSRIIINGRCTLSISEQDRVVCAMLCIGKDKG